MSRCWKCASSEFPLKSYYWKNRLVYIICKECEKCHICGLEGYSIFSTNIPPRYQEILVKCKGCYLQHEYDRGRIYC